ncbi:hypothetical protein QE152_g19072 [Popillia japonica]|uniref:Uncharacterized protein n=1 Tax=Popillia japonica TaxID=7064 RepID=A0AAW1L1A6_POPJA
MAGSSSFTVPILESNNFDNWLFRLTTLFKRDQCEEALEAPPRSTTCKNSSQGQEGRGRGEITEVEEEAKVIEQEAEE